MPSNRWFHVAAATTLLVAFVSLFASPGPALTAVSDSFGLLLMLVALAALLVSIAASSGTERVFWLLMAVGMACWAVNSVVWLYFEVLLRRDVPNPHFSDVVLFFHPVPFIAAVVWRADRYRVHRQSRLTLLSLLMLLAWWMFLYAFLVFPNQYVILDLEKYNRDYLLLYQVENLLLTSVLAWAMWNCEGPWKLLYRRLFLASGLYALGSPLADLADLSGKYYSGGFYDIPLTASVAWIAAAALSAHHLRLEPAAPLPEKSVRRSLGLDAAMAVSVLSLPGFGLWAYLWDTSPPAVRVARVGTVLAAMLLLGFCLFLRHFAQDQTLIALLLKSRRSYESQQRLQKDLVQKEKLASLGQAVAGAAREMDVPLTRILSTAAQMGSNHGLTPEQDALVRKIVAQSERTRNLVSDLLRFSQQDSEEKAQVDICALLQRSLQLLELQRLDGKIKIEMYLDPGVVEVRGNAKQLFQVFAQIVDNAVDALEESGGGTLQVMTQRDGNDVLVLFSDSGPGVKEPHRVFDPFYTTKAIGKGTGLGLSAVYGTVQEHGGQIGCQNKPDGGALFTIRLPTIEAPSAAAARA